MANKYLKINFNSPVRMKPFQLTVVQATKRQRDVTEDSDEEGNFYGKKISPPIHEAKSKNVITHCIM